MRANRAKVKITGNLTLARTMAVHALVAAETFYLLSISQLVPSLFARLKDRTRPIAYVPAIGIVCALLFQIIFSQVSFMNPILNTRSIDLMKAAICLGAGLPVIVPALLLARFVRVT